MDDGANISFHPGRAGLRLSLKDHFSDAVLPDDDKNATTPDKIIEWRLQSYESIRDGINDSFNRARLALHGHVLQDVDAFLNSTARKSRALMPVAVLVLGQNVADHEEIFTNLCDALRVGCAALRLRSCTCLSLKSVVQTLARGFSQALSKDISSDFLKTVRTFGDLFEYYQSLSDNAEPTPPKRRKTKAKTQTVDNKQLVLIAEDFEGFESPMFNDLLSICAKYHTLGLPLKVVLGVRTSLLSLQSNLHRDALDALAIQHFFFPSPSEQMIQVLDSLLLTDRIPFVLSNELLSLLIFRFEKENYSIEEFAKGIQMRLVQFMLRNPLALFCCTEQQLDDRVFSLDQTARTKLQRSTALQDFMTGKSLGLKQAVGECLHDFHRSQRTYHSLLRLLFVFVEPLPCPSDFLPSQWAAGNVVRLHLALMAEPSVRKTTLNSFAQSWVGWSQDELVSQITRALSIEVTFKSPQLLDVRTRLETFCTDFKEIEKQQEEHDRQCKERFEAEKEKPTDVRKTRLKFHEMQASLLNSMNKNKEKDLFKMEKERFVKFLLKIMETDMRPPEKRLLSESFVAASSNQYRLNTLATPRNSISQALHFPSVYLGETKEPDLCVAFGTFQSLTENSKALALSHWFKYFGSRQQMPRTSDQTKLARFFRAVGELEMIGCLKPASIKNTATVHKVFWPTFGNALLQ